MSSLPDLNLPIRSKNIFKLKKQSSIIAIKLAFLYLSSYFLALYAYYLFINPIYGYMGFEWDYSEIKIIEGVIILLVLTTILPKQFTKPSDFLLHLQLCFPILPMLVLYGATNSPREYMYYTIMSFFLVNALCFKKKLKPVRIIKISHRMLEKLLLYVSYLVIISIIFMGGGRYINFDISNVYETRSASAENLPAIYGYLSSFVAKVLLPFSLLLAIINKNYLFAMFAIVGSILLFALTSHKGPLFFPFVLLAIYFLLKKRGPILLLSYSYFFLIALSSVFFYFYAQEGLFGNLVLRRTYFVPAHLNFVYYDFFSSNPFTYWTQSKISLGILEYPYSIDIAHLIGQYHYNNEEAGANTGWLGSGYANAGFVGMLIYAVIIGIVFSILDTYAEVIGKNLVTATVFVPIFTMMTSSDLPAAFLNHGVVLSLVLFFIFPNNSKLQSHYSND